MCWHNHFLAFLDEGTKSKCEILEPNEYHKMLETIPANQLQQKYGGELQDLDIFW